MSNDNNSMTQGLAQIVQEEAQFNFGINRYFLGIVSAGLFLATLYIFVNDDSGSQVDLKFYRVFGPLILGLSGLFAFGAWQANIIHKKLKTLEDKNKNN